MTYCLSVECVSEVLARGLCRLHYKHLRAGKVITTETGVITVPPEFLIACDFAGCYNVAQTKGLCFPHRKMQALGRSLTPLTKRRERKVAGNQRTKRNMHLWVNFRLEESDYELMLASQGGKCKLCGSSSPGVGAEKFAVDHDHRCCPTKRTCGNCIRGLLCWQCNAGIGNLQDSPELLEIAAKYIRESRKIFDTAD